MKKYIKMSFKSALTLAVSFQRCLLKLGPNPSQFSV